MRPSDAVRMHSAEIRRIALEHRTSDVRVFGSSLRGDDIEGSDLDLLVNPGDSATYFDLARLQSRLEQLLGVPVDVLTPDSLPPSFRSRVLAEARPI